MAGGDLSRVQARVGRQDRPTDRRTGVLPERRNTEAPQRQFHADMRNASRGDVGGAEELLRVLGGATRAAEKFQDYANDRFQVQEQENAAEGAQDQLNGTVDEEQMRQSRAYRVAVSRGQTQQRWYSHLQAGDQGLRALLEEQAAKDLTELTPEARRQEIEEFVEGHFRQFGLDPETGQPVDFGSREATMWVVEQMRDSRGRLTAAAQGASDERTNEMAINTAVSGVTGRLRAGGELNFEDLFENLPPTADRRRARDAAVTAVREYTAELEQSDNPEDWARAVQIVDQLRGSTRSGTAVDPEGVQGTDLLADPESPTPAAAPARTTRINATGAAGQMAQGLRGVGLPDIVVAGFLGNIQHETGFDGSRVGDNGTAFGHVQWRADRVRNFQRIVGVHPRSATAAQAARFIKWELDNPRQAGMTVSQRDAILNARTPEEAARLIDRHYERSNGRSREERARAARQYYGGERPADEGVVEQNPDFQYAAEQPNAVEIANQTSGALQITAPQGAFSLTPQQRAELAEYRSGLVNRIEARTERETTRRQTETAGTFLDRLNGMGTYPTAAEIQEGRRTGALSPQGAAQLIGIIQGDQDRAESRADRAEARAEREEARADRQRARQAADMTERYLGPVYGGTMTVERANENILAHARTIRDPEVRRDFVQQARQGLAQVVDIRQHTPAYLNAQDGLNELEARMIARLPRNMPGFSGGREQAERMVRTTFDRMRTRMGRSAMGDGNIDGTYRSITQELNNRYERAFGRYLR